MTLLMSQTHKREAQATEEGQGALTQHTAPEKALGGCRACLDPKRRTAW